MACCRTGSRACTRSGRRRSNAHIADFIGGVPVIDGFNKVGSWTRWTLGVTFANGTVMVLSALAAAL